MYRFSLRTLLSWFIPRSSCNVAMTIDDQWTVRARTVFVLANREALAWGHDFIGPEHILLGLIKEGGGVGARVLLDISDGVNRVGMATEQAMVRGPGAVTAGKLPISPQAKSAIEFAIADAQQLKHNYVGTEHLLLGLLHVPDPFVARVFKSLGVDLAQVRKQVLLFLGNGTWPTADSTTGLS